MPGRSSQTSLKLLARWQTHSATALDTQQACSSTAAQRLLTTASQATPSHPAPWPADKHSEQLAYSQNLRELRKTWQEERAQKLAAKARADAIRDANKAKSVEAHRRNVSAMKELRMQIHEEKRRLQMAELVKSITRCMWLLAHSCCVHCLRCSHFMQLLPTCPFAAVADSTRACVASFHFLYVSQLESILSREIGLPSIISLASHCQAI